MGIVIFISISCIILGTDAVFKMHAEDVLAENEEHKLCKGKILFRNVHNEGMAFNALERYPKAVKYLSGVLGIGLTIYYLLCLCKKGHFFKKLGLSLLTGGAWSNIYDRFVRGYVVDYIGFESKKKRLKNMTYNIGDFFIFAGGVLVMLSAFLRSKKR